jgi:hypothetical protein
MEGGGRDGGEEEFQRVIQTDCTIVAISSAKARLVEFGSFFFFFFF